MFKRLSFIEKLHSTEKRVSLEDFPQIRKVILEHDNFVLVGHEWGDGDSFASIYALAFLLKAMNKKVKILTGQPLPFNFTFLLDTRNEVETVNSSEDLQDTEVAIFVDIAERSEIDQVFTKVSLPPDTRLVEFDASYWPGQFQAI